MNPNLSLGDKLQILVNNYRYLFDLYRRGRFEKAVDPARFYFYRPAAQEGGRKKSVLTLRPAANDLYNLACDLAEAVVAHPDQFTPDMKEEVAEFVLRSKVLSYEIGDYFLSISPSTSAAFINLSKEISDDVSAYFEKHYGFVSDLKRQRNIIQYLLLIALCGINELYRQYDKLTYEEGIERGEKILSYITDVLPRIPSPPTSGRGVYGLYCYVMGRLNFASGYYQKADAYFRESVEAYSERIQINRGESLVSILATLRRCALAATFGNAYIALIDGKVRDAITLSALACSILKHNCGQVYAAYAELIYWVAKLAEASSDGQNLRKVHRRLRRCRRVFERYVPGTHYVHRAGIQLGIAYHYLAQAEPHRRDRYYNLATAYLKQAISFSEAKVQGRHRNQRMLAEAWVTLSHITIHCRPDEVDAALKQAEKALAAADGSKQYTCEAYLALGAIHYAAAARKSSSPEQKAEHVLEARLSVNKALEINENTNARIRAAGYLRLAELSFLLPNTWPEVRHYYDKWLLVKNSVEHDFLQRWGEKIKDKMLNISEHLFIDVSVSLQYKDWKSRVDEHLAHAAVRALAEELRISQSVQADEGGQARTKSKPKRLPTPKTLIRDFLIRKFAVDRTTAYDWIRIYKLEEKLREYQY
jgi:hypothetical protein